MNGLRRTDGPPLAFRPGNTIWIKSRRVAPLAICLAGIFLSSSDVGVFALMLNLLVIFAFPQRAVNVTAPVEFARLHHLNMHAQLASLFKSIARGSCRSVSRAGQSKEEGRGG